MAASIIVVCTLAVLALVFAFLIAPGRLSPQADKTLFRALYAHRGLHTRDKSVPENSLAAFAAAVEAGYGIELDLNLTTDDQVAVFHDDSLARMCGVEKKIADCSFAELSALRLAGTGEKIPLFSEVLSLVDGKVPLVVELKATKRNGELCKRAYELLSRYEGPFCIESFHPGIVRWFRRNAPSIVRGQLSMGARAYNLPWTQAFLLANLLTNVAARPHFAAYRHEDAHQNLPLFLYALLGGKKVAWTVREQGDFAWCRAHFDAQIFEFFRPQTQEYK